MNVVNKILVLLIIVFFMGCSKEIHKNQYTLAKEELYLSSITEIINKLKELDFNDHVISHLLRNEDINDTTNNYIFVFPFSLVKSDIGADRSGIPRMSIDLCKNGVIMEKEADFSSRVKSVIYDNHFYNMYLSFDRLQHKGLLSNLPENQEDICLYLKTSETASWDFKVEQESNVITFTAEEINTIRAEYESLTK
jgi:hypothetical protein